MKNKLKLFKIKFPVNEPKIFNLEKKNVLKCLNTGWISSQGKFVTEFEKKKFANFNKRKFGISVSNGTAALEIALKSLNLKKNDDINYSNVYNNFIYNLYYKIRLKTCPC